MKRTIYQLFSSLKIMLKINSFCISGICSFYRLFLTKCNFLFPDWSWPPHSKYYFSIWEHLLNHICVTEALNRCQKGLNMVLNNRFSQPYSKYPVWARAYVRSRLCLVYSTLHTVKETFRLFMTWINPVLHKILQHFRQFFKAGRGKIRK